MEVAISVVVPIFNAEKYLKKAISSVLKQSFQNFELILVDDGSTDNSLNICNYFAGKDKRVSVLHQENRGSIQARKTGVEKAQGMYIAFLDADDRLPKNSLKDMISLTGGSESIIVVGHYTQFAYCINIKGWVPPCFRFKSPYSVERDVFIDKYIDSWYGNSNVPVSFCAKLYPTRIFKDYYTIFIKSIVDFWGEDLLTTLQILPKAEKIVFLPKSVYYYRLGGGTSTYKESMLSDYLSLYRYKMEYAKRFDNYDYLRYLSDVEICNVIHVYLGMQKDLARYSEEQLIESTCSILADPTVIKVLSNPDLQNESALVVQHLLARDVTEIIRDLERKLTYKERIRKKLKRFI